MVNFFKRIYRGNIIYAIALIVLGLVFAVWPADSRSVLIRILGVLFVLSGLAVAYTFFRNRTPGQLPMVLIAGIILAILGVLIIVRPESFVEFIIILAGAFILLSGIMNFCQTLSLALLHYRYWWIGMIISILTIMLSVLGHDYFLSYNRIPWMQDAPIRSVLNVQMSGPEAIMWPDLDVDLEIDSLRHPERYPLLIKRNPLDYVGA